MQYVRSSLHSLVLATEILEKMLRITSPFQANSNDEEEKNEGPEILKARIQMQIDFIFDKNGLINTVKGLKRLRAILTK